MRELAEPSDLNQQLTSLRQQLDAGNPELYRQLALYLQVLRQSLPAAVNQACFHLATQVHPDRYTALPALSRQQLHRRLDLLVRRSSCLLTVEQLAIRAARLAEEQQRLRERQQLQWMQSLGRAAGAGPAAAATAPGGGQASALRPPDGSVELGFDLPLGYGPGSWAWPGGPLDGESRNHPPDDDERVDGAAGSSDPAATVFSDLDPDGPGWQPRWQAESAADASVMDAARPDQAAAVDMAAVDMAAVDAYSVEADDADPADRGGSARGSLPRDPSQLLQWLEGFDRALTLQLRDLSHSLNALLLRHGLNTSLLPLSLLDAVLVGRVETQSAPANLLCLQLPLVDPGGPQIHSHALLLRRTDLEAEIPKLRTCRRRLQHSIQELRRMAQLFVRLQRHLRVQEATRLWMQVPRSVQPDS